VSRDEASATGRAQGYIEHQFFMTAQRLPLPWPDRGLRQLKGRAAATPLTSVELCAGAGGQALGLERAGFQHRALVELDEHCCATLLLNRRDWNVVHGSVRSFDGAPYRGTHLVAAGLPCPPFSKAGKQLGEHDERNLFPAALSLVRAIDPHAVLIENVRGFLDPKFAGFRSVIKRTLEDEGYWSDWRLLNASDFGVCQLRPRVVLVALKRRYAPYFQWPMPKRSSENGWNEAAAWRDRAHDIAPTLVGGSHKHGGPDLGPTRARKAWEALGVDGLGIADRPPCPDFKGLPKLTLRMAARLQGFGDDWMFSGGKTAAYRQIGNAFPPPVAAAVGVSIALALSSLPIDTVTDSDRATPPVFGSPSAP
jgi:DNA (cytosine-5)-methyltransferase 1